MVNIEKVIEGNCYCPSPIVSEDSKCKLCGGIAPLIIKKIKVKKEIENEKVNS